MAAPGDTVPGRYYACDPERKEQFQAAENAVFFSFFDSSAFLDQLPGLDSVPIIGCILFPGSTTLYGLYSHACVFKGRSERSERSYNRLAHDQVPRSLRSLRPLYLRLAVLHA